MKQLISIIMSVYNEKYEWIQQSVQSILNQNYTNLQIIIVIDNPDIPEDIRNYLEDVSKSDTRVLLIYNEINAGLAISLNKGLEVAEGEYIARMDADDIAMPERIEEQIRLMQKSKVDVVATGRCFLSEEGIPIGEYASPVIGSQKIKRMLQITSCLIHPTVMIKTSVLKAVGGYRNFSQSQDYDLWLRLLNSGYEFANINKPLLKYRLRNNSISLKNPYVQYMTAQYQRRLYRMRIKYGSDDFSEENFQNYLKKHKAFEKSKNKRYVDSLKVLDSGIHDLKFKKLGGIVKLIKAIVMFPKMFGVLYKKTKGLMIAR